MPGLRLHFEDQKDMEKRLTAAVDAACREGLQERLGVLVTRHALDQFSVVLTPHVPFGTVWEEDHA
jgi:hypothetical protein